MRCRRCCVCVHQPYLWVCSLWSMANRHCPKFIHIIMVVLLFGLFSSICCRIAQIIEIELNFASLQCVIKLVAVRKLAGFAKCLHPIWMKHVYFVLNTLKKHFGCHCCLNWDISNRTKQSYEANVFVQSLFSSCDVRYWSIDRCFTLIDGGEIEQKKGKIKRTQQEEWEWEREKTRNIAPFLHPSSFHIPVLCSLSADFQNGKCNFLPMHNLCVFVYSAKRNCFNSLRWIASNIHFWIEKKNLGYVIGSSIVQ